MTKLEINGESYNYAFNMNALCELEDVCENIDEVFTKLGKRQMKAVRLFLYAGLKGNNDSLENKTVKEIGELVDLDNFSYVFDEIFKIVGAAMPDSKSEIEEDEDDGENEGK